MKGMSWVLATSSCRSGSKATLPQFDPPALPGYISVPSRLGGVYMPSQRRAFSLSRHTTRSKRVKPQACSGRRSKPTSGGGLSGKGWVGERRSPGTRP